MNGFLLPALSLCQREIVRFYRQKSRVIGAILPPLIFWFLIGSGLGGSFRHSDGNYLQFFFPGTVVMILLFTAIFSTISIIEDRKEGFLQSVLVSPVPRFSIVLGKILGGTVIAFLQGLVFVLLAPLVGATIHWLAFVNVLLMLFLISFGLTGLGFLIAWQMDSTQGYHSVMNLFLMPMWFLSGALFPYETAPAWLRMLMVIDPLTYAVSALRNGFYFNNLAKIPSFPSPAFSLFATLLFCFATFAISSWVSSRKVNP